MKPTAVYRCQACGFQAGKWYGPVYVRNGAELAGTVGVAHADGGVTIAELDLAFLAEPVKALAEPFGMGLPSFMKHLKVLEESGLIRSEKVGRVRTCSVRMEPLTAAEAWLSEQRALWQARTDSLADYVENRMAWSEADD